jgi:hypothetical protein
MSEPPPRVERHEATDRFGKISLLTAHELGTALAESDSADGEPIVVRTGGPHRTVSGLAALIDAALAEAEFGCPAPDGPARDGDPRGTPPPS